MHLQSSLLVHATGKLRWKQTSSPPSPPPTFSVSSSMCCTGRESRKIIISSMMCILLLMLMALWSRPSSEESHSVSHTVTDTGGRTWARGEGWTFLLYLCRWTARRRPSLPCAPGGWRSACSGRCVSAAAVGCGSRCPSGSGLWQSSAPCPAFAGRRRCPAVWLHWWCTGEAAKGGTMLNRSQWLWELGFDWQLHSNSWGSGLFILWLLWANSGLTFNLISNVANLPG